MRSPGLTLRIEVFGGLVEELGYWNLACEESDGEHLEYCEDMFHGTLEQVKEMREELLRELDEYRRNCNENNIPIDICYYRVEKELRATTFGPKYH